MMKETPRPQPRSRSSSTPPLPLPPPRSSAPSFPGRLAHTTANRQTGSTHDFFTRRFAFLRRGTGQSGTLGCEKNAGVKGPCLLNEAIFVELKKYIHSFSSSLMFQINARKTGNFWQFNNSPAFCDTLLNFQIFQRNKKINNLEIRKTTVEREF